MGHSIGFISAAMNDMKKQGPLITGIRLYPLLLLVASLVFVMATCRIIYNKQKGIDAVHLLKNHSCDFSAPLSDRVAPAPAMVLEHLRALDKRDDYRSYEPDSADKALIARCMDILPRGLARVLQDRLIGIYCITDFMGGGLTEWVVDSKGSFYGYMALNPRALKTGLSEFLTWKENTCFIDEPGMNLQVDCGEGHSGLLYLLLHEGAHLADYVNFMTPFVEDAVLPFRGNIADSTPFTEGAWQGYDRPLNEFSQRENITFYGFGGGPKISLGRAESLYRALDQSPFVSLYAAANWAEDLAETLAFYHLTEVMGLPYRIIVERKGAATLVIEPASREAMKPRFVHLKELY
jgi:hypothetical protein